MPSLYEPCGLNQMFSLKYGTIPIVRAVGGLKDTVQHYDAATQKPARALFSSLTTASALLDAVDQSLAVFHNKKAWTRASASRHGDGFFLGPFGASVIVDLYRQLVN